MLQDYDASDLDEFSHTILKGCDVNKNGRVSQKVLGIGNLKKIILLF